MPRARFYPQTIVLPRRKKVAALIGASVVLQPPSGAWDWQGNVPSILTGTQLLPPSKAWHWVGNASTLNSSIVFAAAKAWAWAGNAPTVNHVVLGVQKAWAWAANNPTVSKTLAAVQKAWAWTANVPTLTYAFLYQPPKAMWAWVARAAILSGGNIPGKLKHTFNVMRGVMWGVVKGVDKGEMQ